ncbi:MAG: hypothetical protein JWR26_3562 [Pedosphaera sp.]|nr:hypothetical protein [Pedosphaera sp.]
MVAKPIFQMRSIKARTIFIALFTVSYWIMLFQTIRLTVHAWQMEQRIAQDAETAQMVPQLPGVVSSMIVLCLVLLVGAVGLPIWWHRKVKRERLNPPVPAPPTRAAKIKIWLLCALYWLFFLLVCIVFVQVWNEHPWSKRIHPQKVSIFLRFSLCLVSFVSAVAMTKFSATRTKASN